MAYQGNARSVPNAKPPVTRYPQIGLNTGLTLDAVGAQNGPDISTKTDGI